MTHIHRYYIVCANYAFYELLKILTHVSVKKLFRDIRVFFLFIFLIDVFSSRNSNLHDFQVNGDTPAVGLWEEPL